MKTTKLRCPKCGCWSQAKHFEPTEGVSGYGQVTYGQQITSILQDRELDRDEKEEAIHQTTVKAIWRSTHPILETKPQHNVQNMKQYTPTPRTFAGRMPINTHSYKHEVVHIDTALELERDLTQIRAERDALRDAAKITFYDTADREKIKQLEAERDALAALLDKCREAVDILRQVSYDDYVGNSPSIEEIDAALGAAREGGK